MNSFKHVVLFTAFCLLSVYGYAQNDQAAALKFADAARLPYPLEWAGSVTDGRYIYTIGGYRGLGNYNTDLLRYDPQTNQWATFVHRLGSKIQISAVYVKAAGKIYVFGGTGGTLRPNHIIQGVQTIEVSTGKVENLEVINPMASTYGGAVEWNSKIYLFGGSKEGNHTINSLYRFDPASNQFTRLADMPESLQTEGAAVNGVIYTFGGYDAFTRRQTDNIYAYDIAANAWKKAGRLPAFASSATVSAFGSLIVVAGSYDDEYLFGYYNTGTGKFTRVKSNLQPRRAAASAVVNNTLFIIGGASRLNLSYLSTLQTVQAANLNGLQKTVAAEPAAK